MKKLAKIMLLLALSLTLVACGGNNDLDTEEPNGQEEVTGNLVIYTTTYDIEYKLLIEDGFQKKISWSRSEYCSSWCR